MVREYSVGDHVEYRPVEGKPTLSTGIIKDVLVDPVPPAEADTKVMPPAGHPHYMIENDRTHKQNAYKEDVIEQIIH
ncbi:hypothetical protein IWQ62_003677, partial [Dispira parvispora]